MGVSALRDDGIKDACSEYLLDSYMPIIITYVAAFVIFFVNNLLNFSLYRLASFSRFKTLSQEQSTVMSSVFIGQFINMAVIPFIVVYRMKEYAPA